MPPPARLTSGIPLWALLLLVGLVSNSLQAGAKNNRAYTKSECEEGEKGATDGWSQDKVSQCCVLFKVCPGQQATTERPEKEPKKLGAGVKERKNISFDATNTTYNCQDGTPSNKWPSDKQQMCCIQEGIGCPGVDYRGTLGALKPWAVVASTTITHTSTTEPPLTPSPTAPSPTAPAMTLGAKNTRQRPPAVGRPPAPTPSPTQPKSVLGRHSPFYETEYAGKIDGCDVWINRFYDDLKQVQETPKKLTKSYCSLAELTKFDQVDSEEEKMNYTERLRSLGRAMKNLSNPNDWMPDFDTVVHRDWCCRHEGMTEWCNIVDTNQGYGAYDCSSNGVKDPAKVWPLAKSLYCCWHWDIACQTSSEICPERVLPLVIQAHPEETRTRTTTTTMMLSFHFTTSANLLQDQRPTATTRPRPKAPECSVGLMDWQNLWTLRKKKRCCQQFSKLNAWPHGTQDGCCSEGYALCNDWEPEYDCEAAFPNWRKAWSPRKKEWCCAHYDRGCQGDQYDCNVGDRPMFTWSSRKKAWCCEQQQVGCEGHRQSADGEGGFDCQTGLERWRKGWSDKKKRWCCQHFNKGCEEDDASSDFDCEAGLRLAKTGWSPEKKKWCCMHEEVACDLVIGDDWGDDLRAKFDRQAPRLESSTRTAAVQAPALLAGSGLLLAAALGAGLRARRAAASPPGSALLGQEMPELE